jgi:hypothetical protein
VGVAQPARRAWSWTTLARAPSDALSASTTALEPRSIAAASVRSPAAAARKASAGGPAGNRADRSPAAAVAPPPAMAQRSSRKTSVT